MNSDTVLRLINTAIHQAETHSSSSSYMSVKELEVIKDHILRQDEELLTLREDITDITINN